MPSVQPDLRLKPTGWGGHICRERFISIVAVPVRSLAAIRWTAAPRRCRVSPVRLVVRFSGLFASLAGCTSFGAVRSADVYPGPSLAAHVSAAPFPGDIPGWFWSWDCASDCNHPILSADVSFAWGLKPSTTTAVALAAGLSGTYPYADAYLQLSRRPRRSFGIGARLGIPTGSWNEYAIYARVDRPLGAHDRLLFDPAVFYHVGNSPNGQNPGWLLAFAPGIGLMIEGKRTSVTPAVSLVAGGGDRRGDSFGALFLVLSVGLALHGNQVAP